MKFLVMVLVCGAVGAGAEITTAKALRAAVLEVYAKVGKDKQQGLKVLDAEAKKLKSRARSKRLVDKAAAAAMEREAVAKRAEHDALKVEVSTMLAKYAKARKTPTGYTAIAAAASKHSKAIWDVSRFDALEKFQSLGGSDVLAKAIIVVMEPHTIGGSGARVGASRGKIVYRPRAMHEVVHISGFADAGTVADGATLPFMALKESGAYEYLNAAGIRKSIPSFKVLFVEHP